MGETKKIADLRCANCGARVDADDAFCSKCGTPVHGIAERQEPAPPYPVEVHNPRLLSLSAIVLIAAGLLLFIIMPNVVFLLIALGIIILGIWLLVAASKKSAGTPTR